MQFFWKGAPTPDPLIKRTWFQALGFLAALAFALGASFGVAVGVAVAFGLGAGLALALGR